MFERLDDVPWEKVRHAYGKATDATRWIRALDSFEADERAEAINHFLWSSAYHQGTLYSATPFVVHFVIEALCSPGLTERDNGCTGELMKWELLHFVHCCAESGQRAVSGGAYAEAPTIEDAVCGGVDVYALFATDSDRKVASAANWLLQFCGDATSGRPTTGSSRRTAGRDR